MLGLCVDMTAKEYLEKHLEKYDVKRIILNAKLW
jgi:hypothetical protein